MSKQANTFIKLGKLIKKKRPPKQHERVNQIAESSLTTEEKIICIEEIDRKLREPKLKPKPVVQAKKRPNNIKKPLLSKGKDVVNRLQKPIEDLKLNIKKIIPSKFFSYLFHHRTRIREFGTNTKTLKKRFF